MSAKSQYAMLCEILADGVGPLLAKSVCSTALKHVGLTSTLLEQRGVTPQLVGELIGGLEWFCKDPQKLAEVASKLRQYRGVRTESSAPVSAMVEITAESHIVEARGKARAIAQAVGFGQMDQIKISTAVSEVARNIINYAGKGTVTITSTTVSGHPAVHIVARDDGPGIPHLEEVLSGSYHSKTGMGLGLLGCKKLMDQFAIAAPQEGGTLVTMTKVL